MIVNDLMRLRWQILDECLRDSKVEYFMGDRHRDNETGATRNLHTYINERLRQVRRTYSCSKRILQNDLALFQHRGARLEPSFRRGHKRILRYINLEWKNPLLREAPGVSISDDEPILPSFAGVEGGFPSLRALIPGVGSQRIVLRLKGDLRTECADLVDGDRLTFQSELTPELRRLILGYGCDVEVLEPKALRSEIRQILSALRLVYWEQPAEHTAPKIILPEHQPEAPKPQPEAPKEQPAPAADLFGTQPEQPKAVVPQPTPAPTVAPVSQSTEKKKSKKKGNTQQLDMFGDLFG